MYTVAISIIAYRYSRTLGKFSQLHMSYNLSHTTIWLTASYVLTPETGMLSCNAAHPRTSGLPTFSLLLRQAVMCSSVSRTAHGMNYPQS